MDIEYNSDISSDEELTDFSEEENEIEEENEDECDEDCEIKSNSDTSENEDSDDDISDSDEEDEHISEIYTKNNITLNILSKYERAKILGTRAQQISRGAKVFINIDNVKPLTPLNIAKEELKQKKIPLVICRHTPGSKIEYWNVKSLINLDLFK